MIPAKFDYARAGSVDDAVRLLGQGGEDAKVLAGGQSLIPLLRLRLAAPSLVVDVGEVAEMRGVRDAGDAIVIGASTTHAEVLADPLVREHASLIAKATATVADRQVRHRGTFGGSLAHADPAGDLPAVAVALGATFEIAGPGGRRHVAAPDFFVDYTLPSAADLVDMVTDRTETPAPGHPLGAKGVGEAGTIASTPAVVNAVVDAVRPRGINDIDMPCTPERVWRALQAAGQDGGAQ